MSTDARRAIAPTLFATAIVGNYICHKSGLPTLCDNTRRTAHTETITGKVVVASALIGFYGWFMPHLLLPKNQHHVK